MPSIRDIQAGDTVIRLIGDEAASVEMRLPVTKVDDELIYCAGEGGWTFCRRTGVEVDHDLGWGPQCGASGSRLVRFIPA
jgi:hypothetical protein